MTMFPTSTQHDLELETALEQHMPELVAEADHFYIPLRELLTFRLEDTAVAVPSDDAVPSDITNCKQGPVLTCGVTLGLVYLTTAIILSEVRDSDTVKGVVDVMHCLLSPGSTAYRHLRGHKYALQRFEQLLKGYIEILNSPCEVHYQDNLFDLYRAAISFAPSPEYITVAHPLFVREAARCRCPGLALAVMRQPVLEVSPVDTGADVTYLHSYYCEGGLLLAAMQCWEDAMVWLRLAVSVPKHLQRQASLEVQVAEASTTTTSPVSPVTALGQSGAICDILLKAVKAFVLVAIISQGGFHDPADRRRAQRVMQVCRGRNTDPYFRLLSAAAQRDGKLWNTLEKRFDFLWRQDGTAEFVVEAGLRLRRHVIRDLAMVANRMYLSDILSAFRIHSLCGTGEVSDAEEISALIQLLAGMQEDGELLIRIENFRDGGLGEAEMTLEDDSSDMSVKPLVVRLELPPKRIPKALGTCQRGCSLLSLTGADMGKKQRYRQAQLRCAMEDRIRRYERAHAALTRATETSSGEGAQLGG
ncbi:hypothetical protein TraAM80_06009 [Trypanosoma rangeli]|uniref:COP9 signalosome complex subunit 3 N-terminal helical repeats domain-containing protein n=1 Tax=Trypanosoma rangeli TaxID=5698 RepID=A0A422NCE9_TRYRA|nr:uncharacterized protein TraAM80_06009 [Trypanosoma rangeli]RNF03151.1 hypothetical protein TraAM80_06009 [Trypanosoma rangeli]|eukprot:RNF03151.1 hypothetical protein TraAM80_06009 [Trypanosoma rangeli]